MTTRGIDFLDKWMAEQLPATDDPVVISDLAYKVMRAAEEAGIPTTEISEEVSGVSRSSLKRCIIVKAARLE